MDIGAAILQFVTTYILPSIGMGLAGLLTVWVAQWQARAKVAAARANLTMAHSNSDRAVQAIEQMYPNYPPEIKAQMALTLSQEWNSLAKISFPDATQIPSNEAGVFKLPATPNTSNVLQEVPATPRTVTTTTVVTPEKLTIDDSKIAKG